MKTINNSFLKTLAVKFLSLLFLCILVIQSADAQDIKWNPGHYILLPQRSERSVLESRVQELKDISVIRGYQIRYYWNDLEPERDVYNFSQIIDDLNFIQSKGLMLVVQIQFKTFNNNHVFFPSYLMTPEFEGGIYQLKGGGYNLRLWNEDVLNRFKALITALGTAIDSHPALALFNLEESATSEPVDSDLLATWWNTQRPQFMQGLASLGYTNSEAFPATPTISYFNSNQSEALYFEASSLASGNGVGGPDVYVGVFEKDLALRHSYNLAQRLAGKVPVGFAVQWNNFTWVGASSAHADPRGAVPPVEHYEFAKDVLGANFIFWIRRVPYWNDVKNLLSNLSFLNDPAGGLDSRCPELLPVTCTAPTEPVEPLKKELLVFDFNRPVTKVDQGFARAEQTPDPSRQIKALFPGSNQDWQQPVNFAEGNLHFRCLIRQQPVVKDMMVKFCFWQDDQQGNPYGKQICTPPFSITGISGKLVSGTVPVSSLVQVSGNGFDWSMPRSRHGFFICNSEGEPVSDMESWNWQSENPDEWYPLDMRYTLVATAKDYAFSGWNNYIWEEYTPVDDSPVERGLVAYWGFNSDSARVTPDGSGNGNNLSLAASATLAEGKYENALYLPSGSQSMAFLEDNLLSNNFPGASQGSAVDSFSITAWIRVHAIEERSPIITKEFKDKRGFEFAVKNGRLAAQIFKNETTGTSVSESGTLLETNRWYHVAMTYSFVTDGTSVIRFYLDGQEDHSVSTSVGPLKTNNAPVRVGAYIWADTYKRFFNGIIDEMYVYNKTLNEVDIHNIMNSDSLPVTEIQPTTGDNEFIVYPNPGSSAFSYKGVSQESGQLSITIHNLQGQLIETVLDKEVYLGPFSGDARIDHLPVGIYIIAIKTDNTFSTLKFVKK